jgi:hypothetical protein
MEEGQTEQKVSKYNSGIAIQMRLDGLWKQINQFCIEGKFMLWNAVLDRVWSELSRDIKENEYGDKKDKENKIVEGYKSKYEEFDESLREQMPFKDNAKDDFKPVSKEDIEKRAEQYEILMEKELFLKRLENHLGKGTATDDEDESDF